tara:strand:- start:1005 stop:2093 length:1089 start_codon:yes stop_codon:yes gene_type:complete
MEGGLVSSINSKPSFPGIWLIPGDPFNQESDFSSFFYFSSDFNIKKIKMSFYFNILKLEEILKRGDENRFCYNPFEGGCDNYGGIGLLSKFPLSLLGFKSNISTGVVRYNSNDDWRIVLSINPQGRSSTFNIPAPFTKVKGRYKGRIYIDQNSNGERDAFERGIPNVILYLNGDNAVTDSRGYFEFSAMNPKKGEQNQIVPYQLSYDPGTLPAHYQFSDGFKQDILIIPGDNIIDEIPMTFVGKIFGITFIDNNNNNIFDENVDKKLPNVRLILESMKNIEKETFSDINGFYQFSDLKPGSYVVSIDKDWLPERTEPTGQDKSDIYFNYYGWINEISFKKMNINKDIPIGTKDLEIKWDIKP